MRFGLDNSTQLECWDPLKAEGEKEWKELE